MNWFMEIKCLITRSNGRFLFEIKINHTQIQSQRENDSHYVKFPLFCVVF